LAVVLARPQVLAMRITLYSSRLHRPRDAEMSTAAAVDDASDDVDDGGDAL